MKVTREGRYTVEMGEPEAVKLNRALSRALAALGKLPLAEFEQQVTLGTVDSLATLQTALFAALPVTEEDG